MSNIFSTEKVDAAFNLQVSISRLSSILSDVHIAKTKNNWEMVVMLKRQYAQEIERIRELVGKL